MSNNEKNAEQQAGRHPKAVAFEREGADALGGAAKVVSSTFVWAVLGFLFGAVVWTLLYAIGLLDVESPLRAVLAWVLLPTYMVIGAVTGAYAGTWRGIGLAMLEVGVKRGMVIYLLERTLDRLGELVRKSDRVAAAQQRAKETVQNLPLQVWEDRLKQAVDQLLSTSDAVTSPDRKGAVLPVVRKIRKYFYKRIERYLFAIVRQEIDAEGRGGGVSVAKVRNIALDRAEKSFSSAIKGMMSTRTKVALVALLLLYAVAPVAVAFG